MGLTRDEAARLLEGLRTKREAAIDAGELEDVRKLDAEIERLEAALDGRRPAQKRGPAKKSSTGKGCLFAILAFFGLGVIATLVDQESSDTPPDRPEVDSVRVAQQTVEDSLEAIYGTKPGGSYSIRDAASRVIESVARNPESVDVRACTAPTPDEALGGWTVRCEYTAQNGFGGTNREVMRFLVFERDGLVSALPVE